MTSLIKLKAINRIRQYSGEELKGREFFMHLGIDYVGR